MHENEDTPSQETPKIVAKKRKQKRLTNEEFLKTYERLWKEGPKVKYLNPENWVEHR